VILLKLCRNTLPRILIILVIISSLAVPPAFCQETEDSQVFIAGFNAYQQKDYASSIEKMTEVLEKYPDTPLRDMALFWLSRSYYKAGNQRDAARYLSQLSKEYPDNPLKSTVEDELLSLMTRYDKGEQLSAGSPSAKQADLVAAKKAGVEKERIAAAKKAEEVQRIAAEAAAEEARIVAARQAEEKSAAEKREIARVAAAKADQERIALETAAREKTEQQRIAAIKAEEARKVAKQAEQQRIAAARAEETKRVTGVKAEQDRMAAANAKEALRAAAAAEASLMAERERKTAELAAAAANRIAAVKAEEANMAEQKRAEDKIRGEKSAYREKAIAQYKTIIDQFPSSTAAATAAVKLRELGVAVALPVKKAEITTAENAQILHIEVAQFAGFEFNLPSRPDAFAVGRPLAVPFEIINRGNGSDSFYLESAFPADFKASFAASVAPGVAITQTPPLAPGETFKGLIDLVIPSASIDGLRISHPVKAASRLMAEASQSREVQLIASAPLLRAVLRTEKSRPLPGEKVIYRIAILNVGSAIARNVTFRLNFPPQLEPLDYVATGFRQETKSALVLDGLQVKSGENREFIVAFQLKEDSLAGQELLTRAELINNPLNTSAAFVSNTSWVESRRSIAVRTSPDRLMVVPGQTLNVPFVVANNGNVREKFRIIPTITGANEVIVFNDLNRDGIRQAGEPSINEIGPLAPREEASIVVEVHTPQSAADADQGRVRISLVSEGDNAISASALAEMTYSRPVLKMTMIGRDVRPKPGDVSSFDLTIANNGSNLARSVELQSAWPEQLELVAADPATSAVSNGKVTWRFKEMGAGEIRSIKVSFRVKPLIGVGTAIQVKNVMTYEDQLGNRY
jgi:hypothetical protein